MRVLYVSLKAFGAAHPLLCGHGRWSIRSAVEPIVRSNNNRQMRHRQQQLADSIQAKRATTGPNKGGRKEASNTSEAHIFQRDISLTTYWNFLDRKGIHAQCQEAPYLGRGSRCVRYMLFLHDTPDTPVNIDRTNRLHRPGSIGGVIVAALREGAQTSNVYVWYTVFTFTHSQKKQNALQYLKCKDCNLTSGS